MLKFLNKDMDKNIISSNVVYEKQPNLPVKVIQFGEGNFLRGFMDWMVHELNKKSLFNGKVIVVQPRSQDKIPVINSQDGLYTVVLKGFEQGKIVNKCEIVSSISRGINIQQNWLELLQVATSKEIRFIFSNTTEAGLTYLHEEYDPATAPISFPGKLTALLYHRFSMLREVPQSGLVIIPCELVEENGKVLKDIVLQHANDWSLPKEFVQWVEKENYFCSTLVDRIVTGYPKDDIEEYEEKLGYKDQLLTVGEPYHFLAIDAPSEIAKEIPFEKAGLNVKWGDITPYREIKVRLLNGPHTMTAAVGYLAGINTVLEIMEDELFATFIKRAMLNEIYPTVKINDSEKKQFAEAVIERFMNPYNKHYLTDIGLSSISKFKVRVLPCLVDYVKQYGKLPKMMTFSLAGLIAFNRAFKVEGSNFFGNREGIEYFICDNQDVLAAFSKVWSRYDGTELGQRKLVNEVLGNVDIWGQDLNKIEDLTETVSSHLGDILKIGMKSSLKKLVD